MEHQQGAGSRQPVRVDVSRANLPRRIRLARCPYRARAAPSLCRANQTDCNNVEALPLLIRAAPLERAPEWSDPTS
eukprot:3952277-Amphidinium_carterae.1